MRTAAHARLDSLERSAAITMLNPTLLNVLARALYIGKQDVGSIVGRIEKSAGKPWRGLPALARRYLSTFDGVPRPRHRDVVQFLQRDDRFREIAYKHFQLVPIRQWLTEPQEMLPAPAAREWNLPRITSIGELSAWFRLAPGELEWFADLKRLNNKSGQTALSHYVYTLIAKRSGGLRLLEAPKQKLKQMQRQILVEILNAIPTHEAAHGFHPGRSIRTFAAPHCGKRVVLRMDIRDFFPSISAGRVEALFRTSGYPGSVARMLAGLCTNAVPNTFWRDHRRDVGVEEVFELRGLYGSRHLPQGAPTSPALGNLCAYSFDCRLHGLARSAGAEYTRYADDLAFSGGEAFNRQAERFSNRVGAILLEEGFRTYYRKTRIMHPGVRQHLAGLVTNQHLNIARDTFDELKAILTNCVRKGPHSQNRESVADFRAHLNGRVSFVESIHPGKGAKLRAIFERISW